MDLSISINRGKPRALGANPESLGLASKTSRSPNSSRSRFTRIGSKQLHLDDHTSSADFSSYVKYSSRRSRRDTDRSRTASSNNFIDEYYL